jgi:hypothetical protein
VDPIYEELLGQYKDHPLMGPHLQFTIPDWSALYNILPMVSSGERIMVQIALTLYNGFGATALRDIFLVDRANQERILRALELKIRGT